MSTMTYIATTAATVVLAEAKAEGTGSRLGLKVHSTDADYRYSVTADQARLAVVSHLKDGDDIEVWYFDPEW